MILSFGRDADLADMRLKTLVMSAILSGMLFAQEYWIQVLSVEGPVPDAYIQMLEKNEQAYKLVKSGDENKVWIGGYKEYEDAQRSMNFVRCQIASDAFIVKEEAAAPIKVEQVPDNLALITHPSKPVPGTDKSDETIADQVTDKRAMQDEIVAADLPKTVEAVADNKGVEGNTTAVKQPCVCICDKRALHKAELDSALAFYKNSPDYRFEPMPRAMPGF